ncbi:peptidoglycan-binding protein LysM [uncultured Dokdonia sp.]|jgi:hypothetical protein|uniref:peptidoglycan-binding protein LysM n=1 Tax=Dokdonia sp. Asnod2-E02 TaxID=3160574 RepID=UPI0026135261|nr:peptidoglycan-binding protein LysM [uncultured Dokdonia sp.]
MVRNLIKVTVLPLMLGILIVSNKSEKTYDFSHYTTDGIAMDFSVPLPEETVQTPFVFNPTPLTGKNYTGFKEALAFKESRGDYLTINRFGYLGKYQFGASTLDLLGIQDGSEFLENPVLQEQAFLLNASRNKWVLRRDIKRYEGRWISGVRVTESGILAAAHLAGPGSVKKFLRSGGATGFQDAFGTSIRSYMKRFSGYDVSNIEAIKKPSLQNLSASL